MAIAIVEDLWGRIRAHIDDKIAAAAAASESAVAAKTAAEAAATEVQDTAANAAAVAAANVAAEMQDLTDRAETAATTATTAVAAEVEKLKGDAPEAFDTLGEIAAELAANESERSALTNSIAAKADKVHDHTVEQVTGLRDELDGKAPVSHGHTIAQVTGLEDALATAGGPPVIVSTTPPEDTDAIWVNPDEVPPAQGGGPTAWGDIQDKPSTYPPESHSHSVSEVTGLQDELDGKASVDHTHTPASIGAAPASHTHSQYATTAQVEARTPEIRVVATPEQATTPGVLYVVEEG